MKYKELFDQLHISLPAMFAGLAGGAISMIRYRDISARRALVLVPAGMFSAAYLSEPVIKVFNLGPGLVAAIGFLIGLFFIVVFDLITSLIKYMTKNPKDIVYLIVSILPFSKFKNQQDEKSKTENGEDDQHEAL